MAAYAVVGEGHPSSETVRRDQSVTSSDGREDGILGGRRGVGGIFGTQRAVAIRGRSVGISAPARTICRDVAGYRGRPKRRMSFGEKSTVVGHTLFAAAI